MLAGVCDVILDWADFAEKEISSWEDTRTQPDDSRYREMFETVLAKRRER